MALWFSASAIVPTLVVQYHISIFEQALLSSSVQAGFVAGSLTSAGLGLADRLDSRHFFMCSATVAAIANGCILLADPTSSFVLLLRFAVGICMAGIYPVGMKLAATWASRDMGLLVGILVGALTLGSATPHLFNALGGVNWRFTLAASSLSAVVGGVLINFSGLGPNHVAVQRFDPSVILTAWRRHSLRLANLGYLGHMWELYAMWAWIGVFVQASFAERFTPQSAAFHAKLVAFGAIGVGAFGCIAGGLLADRFGRTTITIVSMSISGTCAATVGLLFGQDPTLVTAACLIWGFSIVADSAQFSASIVELSDRAHVGTMLTVQTAIGFTLTLVTIQLMPIFVELFSWHFAFLPLALGPFLGVLAMARLRTSADAGRLAGGKR